MSDNLVSGVARLDLNPSCHISEKGAARSAQASQLRANPAEESAPAGVEKTTPVQEPAFESTVEKPTNPLTDLSLKFKIDAETNEVTILLLDRASRKVVRSIPLEEMNRLNPGELLELFA